MRLTYNGMNDTNELLYFWITQLGKLNYDLNASIRLLRKLFDTYSEEDRFLSLYLNERMCISFNEGIKLLKRFDKEVGLNNYISLEFRKTEAFELIVDEMDYNNLHSFGNRYLKNFRDKSVHYKDAKLEDFKSVLSYFSEDAKLEFDKAFNSEYHIEDKSQYIHLMTVLGLKAIDLKEFELNTGTTNNAMLLLTTHLIGSLYLEIASSNSYK